MSDAAAQTGLGWRPRLESLVFATMMVATILYAPFGIPPLESLAVLLALLYLAVDWLGWSQRVELIHIEIARWALIGVAIGAFLIVPMISMIQVRWQTAPWWAHDGLIQTEIAVDYLLEGRNPYSESYAGTDMARAPYWLPGPNPAIDYLAYLPLSLLSALPFQYASQQLWGWFDQRVITLIALALCAFLVWRLPGRADYRRIALILLAVNPISALDIASGYNDLWMLAPLLAAVYAMTEDRPLYVAFWYALACLFKQPAWFAAPFILLWFAGSGPATARLKRALAPAAFSGLVFGLLLLPWLIWDAFAFVQDTFFYVAGMAGASYPINGMGFGGLLLNLGVVASPFDSFPFSIFQFGIGGLVLALMLAQQWKQNSPPVALMGFSLTFLAFGFFGRFFHVNYFTVVIFLLSISAALHSAPAHPIAYSKESASHAA